MAMRVKKSHRDIHSHRSYIERSPPLKDVPQTRNNKKSTVAEAIRRVNSLGSHQDSLLDPLISRTVIPDGVMTAALEAIKKIESVENQPQDNIACQLLNRDLYKWLQDHGEMPPNLVSFRHPDGWQETERISRLKTLNSQKQRQVKAQGSDPMENRNPRKFKNSGLEEKYITPSTEAKRFNDWLRKQQALKPWTSEVDIYTHKGASRQHIGARSGGYVPPQGYKPSVELTYPSEEAHSRYDHIIGEPHAATMNQKSKDLGFVDLSEFPLPHLAIERGKAFKEALAYEEWLRTHPSMVDTTRINEFPAVDHEAFYKSVISELHGQLVNKHVKVFDWGRTPNPVKQSDAARYLNWLYLNTTMQRDDDVDENIPILTEPVDVGKPAVDDPPFDPPYETVNPEVRKETEAIRHLVEKNWRNTFKQGNHQVLQAFYKAAYHRYWTPRLPALIEETNLRIEANLTTVESKSGRTDDDDYYMWLMAKTDDQPLDLDRTVRIRIKDEDGTIRTVLQHRTTRDDKGSTSGKSPLINSPINNATGEIGLNLVEGGTSASKRSTSAVRRRPVHERIEPTLELPPQKLVLVTDPDVVEKICDGHYDLNEFFNRINMRRVDTG